MTRKGMTLTEILLVLALMALVFLSGATLSRGSLSGVQTRSVADLAAQTLRTARDAALARHQVVAVAFPSNGGLTPLSVAALRLEGDHAPRLTQVLRLDRDYPDATFFAGWWTQAGATLDPPVLGDASDAFDLVGLALPAPQDPTLIFCPNGSVRSNGWPRLGGDYQLVVTNGATFALQPPAGTAGSALCCRLTGASRAHTISISPLGEIKVTAGVPGSTDVSHSEGPLARGTLAAVPALPGPPAAGPTITEITYSPDMDRLTLPTDVEVLITADSYVGLTVKADSPEGCPLYCRWTVAAGQGGVSSPDEVKMEWEGDAWVSRWSWRPPLSTANSLQYRLTCQVRDSYGNLAPDVATSQIDAEVTYNRPKVVFSTDQGLYSVNQDASGLRRLTATTLALPDRHAQLSPDGQRLLFSRGFAPPTFGELCLADADGQGIQVIASNLLQLSAACSWSPSGTRIAWMGAGVGGLGDVFVANADGSGSFNLSNSPEHESFATPGHGTQWLPWREVGSELEVLTSRSLGAQLHVMLLNVTTPTATPRDLTPGMATSYPSLSHDGQWVCFNSGSELWKVPADGSAAATVLTGTGGLVRGASCFSSDNQWAYYLKEGAWDPYGGQFELRRIKVSDGTGDSPVLGGRNMTMARFFPGLDLLAFVCPDPPSNDNLLTAAGDGSGAKLLTNLKPYKRMHGVWGGLP